MKFLDAIQAKPNQQFPTFDLTVPDSLTLSIGQDCINFWKGNVKKTLEKFSNHTTEIVLTEPEPDPKIFNNILDLIAFHDEIY